MRCAALALVLLASPSLGLAQESRSVGAPDRGRLEDGVQLRDSEHYVRLASGGVQWGTDELVALLERSAARLQAREDGPRLLVGSLSSRNGGRLRPHESHQSGRDADVSIFVTDDGGEPVVATRFVALDRRTGCGRNDGRVVCIDPRRTYLFIASLVEDESVRVRFVLLAGDLRQLVLAAGRRADTSDEVMQRVEEITALRRGSDSHRSHLHIRIECPDGDRTCSG